MKSDGIIAGAPCRKCGKTLRHDYKGFCMDCADELGISEIFQRHPAYKKRISRAMRLYPKK